MKIGKVGSPTGNVWCELWNTSGGNPSTIIATSNSVDVATLGSPAHVTFTFTPPASIPGVASVLAVGLAGDFTMNDADYLQGYGDGGSTYLGDPKKWNGSAWSNDIGDYFFRLWGLASE